MKSLGGIMVMDVRINRTINVSYENDVRALKKCVFEAFSTARRARRKVLKETERYNEPVYASFVYGNMTVTVTPDSDKKRIYREALLCHQLCTVTGSPESVGPHPNAEYSESTLRMIEASAKKRIKFSLRKFLKIAH